MTLPNMLSATNGRPESRSHQSPQANAKPAMPSRGRFRPLGLGEVRITGGFWGERQDRNRVATLAHIEHWLEREGLLGNFDAAARGELPGARRGREFSDSEVYKLLEALAWEYGRGGDESVDDRFRTIAARVAAAEEGDGYLNTNFGRPGQAPRYSDLEWGHELYNYGHLIQAGVARARTVGHDEFVRLVLRVADHVCETFGDGGIESVCGHPEIEPALVELYRVTGEHRYLHQADLFVNRRGHQVLDDIEFGRAYFQDDMPIREATVLRGHAVRAMYLAAGAADLAAETGDDELLESLDGQWRETVARRTYLTGGIGSRHQDEAFGEDYFLPSDRAYSETCAGIGSIMFSWRMLLARGESRFADLIERTLYNVVATSPSADGTRFYYTNTLHQRVLGTEPDPDEAVGRAASMMRAPWFSVSCCPTNVARTFASLAAYVATSDDQGVQIHQYATSTIDTSLPDGRRIAVDVETDYPSRGRVTIRVNSDECGEWTLSLRVPSWARGAVLWVGDEALPAEPGVVRVTRNFGPGDVVRLELPLVPKFVVPDPRIDAVRGCLAIERGPEVLCLESVDLSDGVGVDEVRLDPTIAPHEVDGTVMVALSRETLSENLWPYGDVGSHGDGGQPQTERVAVHPYHDWANRGPSTMRVWLPTLTQERLTRHR